MTPNGRRSIFARTAAAGVVSALLAAAAAAPSAECREGAGDADPFAAGEPIRLAIGNGLTSFIVSCPRSDDVAMRLEIGAGASSDPEGKEGLAALALDALLGPRSGPYPGGTIDAGPDSTSVRFRCEARSFGAALGALAERLGRAAAAVDGASVEAAKKRAAERAGAPGARADEALAALVFGAGHPAGRAWRGTLRSIEAIGLEDARRFAAEATSPARAALAAAGPIAGVDSLAEFPIRLAAWPEAAPARSASPPPPPAVARKGRRALLLAGGEGKGLEVRAAFFLPPRSDPRLSRAAAAAAVALSSPPAGSVAGSFSMRAYGRPGSSLLVVAFGVSKPEDAARALASVEASLASARASFAAEKPIPGLADLPPETRAAVAVLDANLDDDGTSALPAASAPAVDLDAWSAVVAGADARAAETALRAIGLSIEKP